MRNFFLVIMVGSFFGLGVVDILHGRIRLGMASILLGVIQLLIFGVPK